MRVGQILHHAQSMYARRMVLHYEPESEVSSEPKMGPTNPRCGQRAGISVWMRTALPDRQPPQRYPTAIQTPRREWTCRHRRLELRTRDSGDSGLARYP